MRTDSSHRSKIAPVHRYVALVSVVGACLLSAVIVKTHDVWRILDVRLLPLVLLAVLGELAPISVPRGGEEDQVTTSTTFVFALLLLGGIGTALLTQVVASVHSDLWQRKPLWKTGFNVAQYTISLSAAALALGVFGHPSLLGTGDVGLSVLPAIAAGGAAFFLANTGLTGVALALAQRIPVAGHLFREVRFQALTDGVLLALAPVVVLVVERAPFLLPLLLLPLLAVRKTARVSLKNSELVGRLERSLDELHELNRKNEYQAQHDPLTDLPNRTLFRSRIQDWIVATRDHRGAAAVMIVDLDRFKEINDTLGHDMGDEVLRQVGARLRGAVGGDDVIARLGGDEFAIFLPVAGGANGARGVANGVQAALDAPIDVEGLSLAVEASIGIALSPDDGVDADVLLRKADLAMYVAKSQRRGSELYAPQFDQRSPRRLALLAELRRAIDEGELILHYQPQARLDTGVVRGVEALVRWQHPRFGLLPPGEFVPFAEHTNLMKPLTMYVLTRALRQLKDWMDAGMELTVAVNLSTRALVDHEFPREVARVLDLCGVPPDRLELEITESTVLGDPGRALAVLHELSSLGCRLAVDDFGTGYSSLAYLRRLPVDQIKIDRSFVMNMTNSEHDAAIVKSTIDLGRNLGLEVVAEGVESEEAWADLAELRCDTAQGYYLSRPIAPADLIGWLGARRMDAEPSGALTG